MKADDTARRYAAGMHRLIASCFGTGLILRRVRGSDMGSGTFGSVFALGIALLLGEIGWPAQAAAAVVVTVASVWASSPFANDPAHDGGKEGDPGWVVVDEAAGTFVATIGLGVPAALVAWAVFRVADIFKRAFPGVAAAEGLGGGVGITADDLVAGLYGLVAGALVTLALG
jgi:phosphatidylglycerophosphatase A